MSHYSDEASKLPWIKFSFKDWMNDVPLSCCSMAAQGLWMRMICMMHHGKPYGHLSLNGTPLGLKELSRMVRQSPNKVKKCLAELENYGVYSKDSTGIIFSRRLVRDEAQRLLQKSQGAMGGNPNLAENYQKEGNIYAFRRNSDGAIKIGIALNPTHRLYKIRYQYRGDKIEMLNSWPVDNMGKKEKEIHALFAHKKHEGEWFNLTPEDLSTLDFTLKGKTDLPLTLEVDVRENGLQPKPLSRNTAVKHQTARKEDDTALLAQEESTPPEPRAGSISTSQQDQAGNPPDAIVDFGAWVRNRVPNWAKAKAHKAWAGADDRKALQEIFGARALFEIQACWELFITRGSKSYDHAVGHKFSMREFQRQVRVLVSHDDYASLKRKYLHQGSYATFSAPSQSGIDAPFLARQPA